jgi:type IV secretory pathway VirB2 component (pilin)
VEALLAFAAALLALRLAGRLAGRWRARRAPELAMWSASLLAYAAATAALAWGAAAGWNETAFRLYYLFGGQLTAPLLGSGSLLLLGKRWVLPVMLVYAGLAAGVMVSEPLGADVAGTSIPEAQEHLDYFPARILALIGNIAGTVAVIGVAAVSFRRRPLGMSLLVAGVVVAAVGSALAGLGAAQTAAFSAVGVVLLYTGFTVSSGKSRRALPAEAR